MPLKPTVPVILAPMTTFVLIHSPLVGPSSLAPTAAVLQTQGFMAHVPTPDPARGLPAWRDWPQRLMDVLPKINEPILVGHSAGGLVAASLAASLRAKAVICLDAMMPPEKGLTPPVEADFMSFVRTLPIDEGLLPIWTDWWDGDLLAGTPTDNASKALFLAELPRLPLSWFEDAFEMPDWSACARGYIQTSPVFEDEASRAEELGWPVARLKGTHLHPALAPAETAQALIDICRTLSAI